MSSKNSSWEYCEQWEMPLSTFIYSYSTWRHLYDRIITYCHKNSCSLQVRKSNRTVYGTFWVIPKNFQNPIMNRRNWFLSLTSCSQDNRVIHIGRDLRSPVQPSAQNSQLWGQTRLLPAYPHSSRKPPFCHTEDFLNTLIRCRNKFKQNCTLLQVLHYLSLALYL